jgi:drug/metabolite transporter (DMT)-like permease
MTTKKASSVADLLLLVVAAIWGSSYAFAKEATLWLPVLQFIALRFGLTFVVLLPALRPLLHRDGRRGLAAAGLLGANLLAIFVCETFGVTLTSAGNAAFLISLCVALTPLVEWAMFGRRPARAVFAAAGLSALGAALLAASAPMDLAIGRGDALMLGAALLRAVMVCLTRRLDGVRAMPAATLTALQSGVIAIGAAVLATIAGHGRWAPWPAAPVFWGAIAWLVLACTVFAFFVQNYAAVRSAPSRVALLMGSEPLFGALVAALWLGERLSPAGWAGGALIVVSAAWAGWPARAAAPTAAVARPA